MFACCICSRVAHCQLPTAISGAPAPPERQPLPSVIAAGRQALRRDRSIEKQWDEDVLSAASSTVLLFPIPLMPGLGSEGVWWVGGCTQWQLDHLLLSMWNTVSQYIIYASLYSAFNGPFCQASVVWSFKRKMVEQRLEELRGSKRRDPQRLASAAATLSPSFGLIDSEGVEESNWSNKIITFIYRLQFRF